MLALNNARDSRNPEENSNAQRMLLEFYALYKTENPRTRLQDPQSNKLFDDTLAKITGRSPEEARGMFEDEIPDPAAWSDPAALLSYEVTRMTNADAELTLWFYEEAFRPAIFCVTEESAFYVHTFFFAPGGVPSFRICPHCSTQFLQVRANQNYCIPAHGGAHRTARSRAKNKEENNSVTDKTR
jgi:hypothetical protein